MQVFGRLPLAISARCYHARYHNKSKDTCQFVCEKDREGKTIKTLNQESFLVMNGPQTLSYTYVNLISEIDKLKHMGIKSFRLSPHDCDMVFVSKVFKKVVAGALTQEEGLSQLKAKLFEYQFSNGFFYQKPGCDWVIN